MLQINPKLLETMKSRNIPLDFIKNPPKKVQEETQKIKIRPVSNSVSQTQSTNFFSQSTSNSRMKEEAEPKNYNDLDDLEKFEIINEINEFFLQDEITEKNLSEIAKIPKDELHLHLSLNSLQNLGYFCPKLSELKLNGSMIKCLRDIGTSLQELKVLHVSRCQIQDISGIHALPKLQELYASFNVINDLSGVAYHQNLNVLDLEGNELEGVEQIDHLTTLRLTDLNLMGNPISKLKNYRVNMLEKLQYLQLLDETEAKLDEIESEFEFFAYQQQKQEYDNVSEDQDDLSARNDIDVQWQGLNEEQIILKSIKFTGQSMKQAQDKSNSNFMNHTFMNTMGKTNQTNKRQNRYLEKILQDNQAEEIVSSTLNTNTAIQGNPTKALRRQQQKDVHQQGDFLQQILEQKNKQLNISLKSLSDLSEEKNNDKLNKSMALEPQENTKQEPLKTLRISTSKKFTLNRKVSEVPASVTKDSSVDRKSFADKLKSPIIGEKFAFNMKKFSLKQEPKLSEQNSTIENSMNEQNSLIKQKMSRLKFGNPEGLKFGNPDGPKFANPDGPKFSLPLDQKDKPVIKMPKILFKPKLAKE